MRSNLCTQKKEEKMADDKIEILAEIIIDIINGDTGIGYASPLGEKAIKKLKEMLHEQ